MDLSGCQHIADEIACAESPLGIDAKKSHVMILAKLEAIERRLDRLERDIEGRGQGPGPDGIPRPIAQLIEMAPNLIAAAVDTLDDEASRAAARGQDLDRAIRNGLAAALYFGERISAEQLDALGDLLRSDVLHRESIDVVARMGAALVEASGKPRGSAGLFTLLAALGDEKIRRSLAFLIEFARGFGAALDRAAPSSAHARARG